MVAGDLPAKFQRAGKAGPSWSILGAFARTQAARRWQLGPEPRWNANPTPETPTASASAF